MVVYGIRQCDSCRKAIKWLEAQAVAFRFHDLREDGLSAEQVRRWLASPLAGQLLNRRSTTWRNLSPEQRAAEGTELVALLLEHPTLIKRPVFERDGQLLAIGFQPQTLQAAL